MRSSIILCWRADAARSQDWTERVEIRFDHGPVTFPTATIDLVLKMVRAFSSEVDTGSREENASKQQARASVLILSEPIML
jgi:hypothetical protein